MDFQSLNQILGDLKIMERSPQQKQFQKLLECWEQVLGVMAAQTQPLYIERGVLYVATSSAALSQELSFRVPQLLQQLNQLLPIAIENIRFSAAQWHSIQKGKKSSGQTEGSEEINDWQGHPSMICGYEKSPLLNPTNKNENPQTVFQHWAEVVKGRSQDWPICPQCNSPTPPGEIERWSVCAICATKQWSETRG
ncbi:MAG: DciA family protein [Microcoleaceae cyanobacterium MO_207.B10]|nr:DciA family protein [Microcoleaceae cyanobacterium MO_207.B10]